MRQKSIILVFVISITLLAACGYVLTTEKNYNTIFTAYVAYRITGKADTFEEKVSLLRRFVHENIHPVADEECRADTQTFEKLISGIGWCDHEARVFMQLACKTGITTRLLFLLDKNGSSPHSVAEAFDGDRWVLVDPAYDLDLRNRSGKMASRSDVKDDLDIVRNNPKVKAIAMYYPLWKSDDYLSVYYREPMDITTKSRSRFKIFKYLPKTFSEFFVSAVSEIYLYRNRKKSASGMEDLYTRARDYHLIGRARDAERIYRRIIGKDDASIVKDRAYFSLALLLKEEKRYNDAVVIATDLINKCKNAKWIPFAYGLRASLYRDLGDAEKYEEDCKNLRGFPDAYF